MEDVYKLYAESFRGKEHLKKIQEKAQALVSRVLTTRRGGGGKVVQKVG
jgi:phosphoglucomutase